MAEDLARMRRAYSGRRLREADVPDTPGELFRHWLAEAVRSGVPEPNAMVLATVDPEGNPRARHVLLKELDDTGFVFFTNLESPKARAIEANPAVSLCFPWIAMERQVVVGGRVKLVDRAEVAGYWATRPRESQLSAWASRQSQVISSYDELVRSAARMAERFPGDVPLPEFWGGFRVIPRYVEFWQGAPGRLHDRLCFTREREGWRLERLSP